MAKASKPKPKPKTPATRAKRPASPRAKPASKPNPKPTPARTRRRQAAEPSPSPAPPPPPPPSASPLAPPEWLGPIAVAKWTELLTLFADRGLTDERDRDACALYCDAWQQLADADVTIAAEGEYFTTEKGYIGIHPAVLKRRKAVDVIRKLGEQLGLTPRARNNLQTANRPPKHDPLQNFLDRRPV